MPRLKSIKLLRDRVPAWDQLQFQLVSRLANAPERYIAALFEESAEAE